MLGTNIKDLRMQKGITQTDLANSLGRTQQAVAGWENGRFNPDVPTLQMLAKFFGVSTDYLLGLDVTTPIYSEDEIQMMTLYRRLLAPHQKLVVQIISALGSNHSSDPPLVNQTTVKGEINGNNNYVGVVQR